MGIKDRLVQCWKTVLKASNSNWKSRISGLITGNSALKVTRSGFLPPLVTSGEMPHEARRVFTGAADANDESECLVLMLLPFHQLGEPSILCAASLHFPRPEPAANRAHPLLLSISGNAAINLPQKELAGLRWIQARRGIILAIIESDGP
ncbi:hypothetical protein XELAEV_18042105mg [Xenopus laevis]|uniref:Uncharacterized protein n=1 Tax=Xenopus laevis TaxID=8355 RepID=A0A974H620_XENLA|nr:hypothetical protein XELAEV_18042105mg [Xenopus laevis]